MNGWKRPLRGLDLLILLGLVLSFAAFLGGCRSSGGQPPMPPAQSAAPAAAAEFSLDPSLAQGNGAIKVFYKLDSRLTSGVYMGERWGSPPVYDIIAPGAPYVVEAKVEAIDASGRPLNETPHWISEDPQTLLVTPLEGNHVVLTFQSPGETQLQITAGGLTKVLSIQASRVEGAMRVTITQ